MSLWVDHTSTSGLSTFHYGPFDEQVYDVLRMLTIQALVKVGQKSGFSVYALTAAGERLGRQVLIEQDPTLKESLTQCAKWVRVQSFRSLLITIYARYPDMVEHAHRHRQSPARSFAKGVGTILGLYPKPRSTRYLEPQEAMAEDWHAIGDDLRKTLVPFPFPP